MRHIQPQNKLIVLDIRILISSLNNSMLMSSQLLIKHVIHFGFYWQDEKHNFLSIFINMTLATAWKYEWGEQWKDIEEKKVIVRNGWQQIKLNIKEHTEKTAVKTTILKFRKTDQKKKGEEKSISGIAVKCVFFGARRGSKKKISSDIKSLP